MIQKYYFFDGGTVEFDDNRSVRELIQYAFDRFDLYEPAGMDIVTVFQCHHPETNTGWFTLDTSRKCSEELIDRDELCFAYHMPNTFYFAEGGWGHHMKDLGNHPNIPDPVSLIIRFEDFDNTVVINGNYRFRDIIGYLRKTQYIPDTSSMVRVHMIGTTHSYTIPFSDKIMDIKLSGFESAIEAYNDERYPGHAFVYHEVLEIL